MSQKAVVQPAKGAKGVSAVAKPVVEKKQATSTKAKPSVPSKQVAAKASVKELAQKPRIVKKPVAHKAVTQEVVEKSPPTPRARAKPVSKTTSPTEAMAIELPKSEKAAKVKKPPTKKPKLVRDSFTIPEGDYALFSILKQRALTAGVEVKKSELLRASLALLNVLSDEELVKAIGLVERIKTGRPKK